MDILKYLNEILDFLWNNRQWVFSGIGVPFLAWIFAKIITRRHTKFKINISLGFIVIQAGTLEAQLPTLNITITNIGKQSVFIRKPILKLSRKIDGYNTFSSINFGENIAFPYELAPGQEYSKSFQGNDLRRSILSKLEDGDKIWFLIQDTFGKKHYTKKLLASDIKQHFKTTQQNLGAA
ncbi:MAG: hypothetical protein ABSD46_13600 [Bacteroidota bacterium]